MAVISFTVAKQVKEDIERMAREGCRSKDDIFREMYESYTAIETIAEIQKVGRKKFLALGIDTIDRAEKYLG